MLKNIDRQNQKQMNVNEFPIYKNRKDYNAYRKWIMTMLE